MWMHTADGNAQEGVKTSGCHSKMTFQSAPMAGGELFLQVFAAA